MIDRALAWFWGRVGRAVAVPDSSLPRFRWIFGVYLLLFDAPNFAWLDRTPDAFFEPPLISLPYLVGGFPPAPVFLLLDVVAIVAVCTMTIGYRTRASTIVVLVTRLLSTSFAYSLGKISHQIALTALLACMAVANWGERTADAPTDDSPASDGRDTPASGGTTSHRVMQAMALLGIVIAFGFVTAGFDKLRRWTDLDPSTSGILSWYYPNVFTRGLGTELLGGIVPGLPVAVLELADVAAGVLEMVGFVALLSGRIPWRLWLTALTLLHLSNALFLNITFTTQVMVYLAFADLSAIPAPSRGVRRAAVAGVGVLGIWHVVMRFAERGSSFFVVDGVRTTFVVDLYVCLLVCVAVAAVFARQLARSRVDRAFAAAGSR